MGTVSGTVTTAAAAQASNHVQLCATLWTITRQAPLAMGFSRQEYWSGLLYPPPADLPHPAIEPALQAL